MIARRTALVALATFPLLARAATAAPRSPAEDAASGLQPREQIESRFVPSRTVQVWLPPGYGSSRARYPVIYLHDGQNVYDEPAPFSGKSWEVHRALADGIAKGRMRPAILVAVWNNDNRLGEYMPEAALAAAPDAATEPGTDLFRGLPLKRASVAGDAYLRFLVEELKPRIDARYRTRKGRAHSFLMGSSMGGLISAYALVRYPRVFGGAACLSTAWPIGGGFAADWFARHLPDRHGHKLYFDYGTGTNDGAIQPFQLRVDAAARAAGYGPHAYRSLPWPGHMHTESAWAERVHVPLAFLLSR
ncbi:MAG: alpha/beta hydrolase-fold protein [Pseudomonadota bacterium]